MAKSLAIIKKKPIATQGGRELATVKGREITLVPQGQKQLATVKKGGSTIIVGNQGEPVRRRADGTPVRDGEEGRPDDTLDTSHPIGGGRLLRLADAIAAGADPAKAGAKVLSWGNKRVRQKLAEGGTIQRRAGGAGFGGTGSGGQVPPGKGRGVSGKSGKLPADTRTTEDRLREIRERDMAARKASGEAKPKPMLLRDAKKQLALEDSKKQLQLGNGTPAKGGGALGFAASPIPSPAGAKPLPAATRDDTAPNAPAPISAGQLENLKGVADAAFAKVNEGTRKLSQMSVGKQKEVNARKMSDVKAALKSGNLLRAIDLVTTGFDRWATDADLDKATDLVEKAVRASK